MNKRERSSRVAAAASISRTEAAAAVSAVFSVIADASAAGGTVTVPGFGTFSTGHRAARQGRNPRTGERDTIPASKAPAFKHRQGPPRGGQVPPHDDCAAGPCPATVRAASADAGRGCRRVNEPPGGRAANRPPGDVCCRDETDGISSIHQTCEHVAVHARTLDACGVATPS